MKTGLFCEVLLLLCCAGKVWPARAVDDPPRVSRQVGGGDDPTLSGLPRTLGDGPWECGKRGPAAGSVEAGPRIAGGAAAAAGEFPWNVGVYRAEGNGSRELVCGGTLVSSTHAVSAAHCFWSESERRLLPHTLYTIALGTLRRTLQTGSAKSELRSESRIHLPQRYRGSRAFYQNDIAVLQLATPAHFTTHVAPVCVDWLSKHEATQLTEGALGTVVGWGITQAGTFSETLQKIDLPFVGFDTCYGSVDESTKFLVTDDKFCAGFVGQSRSVCRGDSGAGLVFRHTDGRYYLRGVASVSFTPALATEACYSQMFTGFTLVSRYLPWITPIVSPTNEQLEGSSRQKSKSEEMCEQYSSSVFESMALPAAAAAAGIKRSTCAMSPSTHPNAHRLLSQQREFPHLAALGYQKPGGAEIAWSCVGSLVSDLYVLTIARCAASSSGVLKWARLGTVSLDEGGAGRGLVQREVAQIVVHPEYAPPSKYNDIALVKLKQAVVFNGHVRPACLDTNPGLQDHDILTAASWGFLNEKRDEVFDEQLTGDFRVRDHDSCDRAYSARSYRRGITDGISKQTMICNAALDVAMGCAVRGGSPMMTKLQVPFCMYNVVAVVSFAADNICDPGREVTPNVAIRVAPYAAWIESIVW